MRDLFRCFMVSLSLLLVGPAKAVAVEGTVRFDLYWDYVIVAQGTAGPLKGLNFVVDTGASPTIIAPEIARKLHLGLQPAGLASLGGMSLAARTTVPRLTLGPVQRLNLPVVVEDLSFVQKVLPIPIDGIVGLDVLGQSAFVIDYRVRRIQFGPLPALSDPLPTILRNGLAIVQAEVNGVPAAFLLDTGAGSLIMYAGNTQSLAAGLRVSNMQRSAGAIGEAARKQVTLRSLRFGPTDFGRQSLSVVAGAGPPGGGFDGLLSPAGMRLSRVAVDLARGQVAFSR